MDDNKNPPNQRQWVEKRKRTDWVTRMATILSAFSWVITIVVWFVLDRAQPVKENIFTRAAVYAEDGSKVEFSSEWNESLLIVAFVMLIISLVICIGAFIFNMLRKKRKTDKYKISVIVIGCITIAGLALFLNRFWDYLFI